MPLFRRNSLAIVFLFLLFNGTIAQQFPSKNYSTLNGLPNNSVFSVLKDSRGILWVGTDNGVSKIQNEEIQNLYESDGLAYNNCWDIVEDGNHYLWFGSFGGGLTFFDGKKFTIFNIKNGLVNNLIRKLFIYKNYLFVGTHDGVSAIDINTFKITNYKDKAIQGNFQSMDFFEYKGEVYLVSYRDGIFKINLNRKKLELQTTKYHDKYWSQFCVQKKGENIYFGVDGIHNKNQGLNKIKIEDYLNGKEIEKSFGFNVFWEFAEDKRNISYATAYGVNFSTGGVYKIVDDNLINVTNDFGIVSKDVWSINYDKGNDLLYVGTMDKGLYEIDLKNNLKYYPSNLFSDTVLETIDVDHLNGNKYVLYEKGLLITQENKAIKKLSLNDFFEFAKKSLINKYKKLPVGNADLENVEELLNRKIEGDKFIKQKVEGNNIWINSTIGIFSLNKECKINDYYPFFSSNFGFIADKEMIFHQPNHIMFKTKNLFRIPSLIPYSLENKNDPKDVSEIISINNVNYVTSIYHGLFLFENNKFKSYLENNIWGEKNLIKAIKNNRNQLVIANAFGDVFVINVSKGFKIDEKVDRKSLFGNTILFLESYKDYLLIGTEKGLNIYRNGIIRLVDEEQGLKNKIFTSASVNKDVLTIGTLDGFYELNLKEYLNTKIEPLQLGISKVEINYQSVSNSDFKWFSFGEKSIELPYDKNILSITFYPKRHPYPNKLLYRFKLKGLNNSNWSNWTINRAINLPYLPDGKFKIIVEVKDLYSGVITSNELLNVCIRPPFWKTWWFVFGCVGILSLVGFIVYKKRITIIQNQERTKAEVQKRLAETKMEALQSQMNPHFIFNAMNSIQYYIIENNTDDAMMFLGEFSKLIRQTLNNSSKQRINLADELQYLRSYVKLENMRFKNIVNFDIHLDDDLDLFETEIPPMLIQPFVENVFVHAFDANSNNPVLILSFKRLDHQLICEIKDNGKGMRIENLNKLNISKGIKLAKERIALFQSNHLKAITIESAADEGTTISIAIDVTTPYN